MQWSDISWHPSNKMLRQFGLLGLGVFGLLGFWQYFQHHHHVAGTIIGGLGLVLGGLGALHPRSLKPIFVGWMVVAFPIGWVVSHLLLGAVFFGLILPMALVFKLVGRDALMRRPQPGRATYWLPKLQPADAGNY